MRLVAACAENRSTHVQDSCQCAFIRLKLQILGESTESVAIAHDLQVELPKRSLTDAANRRVEARTVTACCNNTDAFCHAPTIYDLRFTIYERNFHSKQIRSDAR